MQKLVECHCDAECGESWKTSKNTVEIKTRVSLHICYRRENHLKLVKKRFSLQKEHFFNKFDLFFKVVL